MEDHQARVLRTMRAWLGVDQAVAAKEMGLGVATLRRAETAESCSALTWKVALSYYASKGLYWREGDDPLPAMLILRS